MSERLSYWENITESPDKAKWVWYYITDAIKRMGRQDILSNPTVLDIGGGKGEFSKYVNSQNAHCASLDIKNIGVDTEAKPVRGDAYKMPFADASFDIIHGRGVFHIQFYLHDFKKLIPEIARVLKKKGILSIFDPVPPPDEELEKFFKRLGTAGEEYPTLWEKR